MLALLIPLPNEILAREAGKDVLHQPILAGRQSLQLGEQLDAVPILEHPPLQKNSSTFEIQGELHRQTLTDQAGLSLRLLVGLALYFHPKSTNTL